MKEKRIFRSPEQWFELIQQCRTSGLDDREWCAQNNVPVSTFYNAVSRCRRLAGSPAIPAPQTKHRNEMHEVVPISFDDCKNDIVDSINASEIQISNSVAIELVVNGYRLNILNAADKNTIRNTILVLQELC